MTISRAQMYRQLYQMGGMGIESLSPMQPAMQPAMQSAMYNPLEENYYSGMPMMMAGGGIANLVNREKYGFGSKLKKFVRNIIPNEVAKVASVAAPFVAPFNPLLAAGMSAFGNFDQTGRIGSSLKRGALTYAGGQAARYLGGAGFQEGFNPFAGADFSGGLSSGIQSLGNIFTSPLGTQTGLQLGQFTDAGKSAINQMEPFVGSPTAGTLSKTPGTLDQLKTIFDPTSNVDLGTRARTAMDLTGDAIKAMYTNKDGSIDKRMVISTISAIPSYLDAKKKADEVGLTSNEFNEQIFNQEKEFFRQRYASATPDASYGITTSTGRLAQAAEGGLMDDTGGILSIKLTPAMAMGGRIGYQMGGLGMESFALTQRPDDLGLPGFDDDPVRDETSITMSEALQLAMDRGQKFYDPIYGFQINPLTKGRMGTDIDPNFIFQRAMQAEQDAAARTKPYVSSNQMYMPGVTRSTVISSPYQTMKQDLLMRQGAVQTGGTSRSASEGSSGINPLFRINRLIQAEQDAAARVTPKKANGGRINYETGGPTTPPKTLPMDLESLARRLFQMNLDNLSPSEKQYLYEFKEQNKNKKAKGGIMGSEIPVRQNPGGITELDLRAKGGYIPVGIKEKADDVPAMLSKNEFVFTADAVRGAGGGNINKGAQKMYKLMKSLEKKVKKIKVA
jgi:hypothetical protein